jgi:hypothetical protein
MHKFQYILTILNFLNVQICLISFYHIFLSFILPGQKYIVLNKKYQQFCSRQSILYDPAITIVFPCLINTIHSIQKPHSLCLHTLEVTLTAFTFWIGWIILIIVTSHSLKYRCVWMVGLEVGTWEDFQGLNKSTF